ncbi:MULTISPECIES: serine protease [unclassified Bradyrhizobium]|uniref:trypsin-like serine peptidase n=1 Tax=unclassified Bradyrhizobium TaxID=2631580 RepID=UPI001FFAC995|nr:MULTISPECIES: serine protease [unclassified Bradyrhizobium]MCK1319615.1 trypsin-like peptidase domain-containing protein [Bradyrhizobium sp. 156]UPJ27819.1 trypsin-like peptidase domain-containing protein [Bradyrhizobium sp. CW1]UPJ96284.1 trypsin-like peptidase domain-containing protein [Bradyrhizobium sp. 172]
MASTTDDPPETRPRQRFPESEEERAARLVAFARGIAAPAAGHQSSSALESMDDGGLPGPEALQQRIVAQLDAADSNTDLPQLTKEAMARDIAQSGHEIATQIRGGDARLADLNLDALSNLEAVIRVVGRPAWYVRQNVPAPEAGADRTRDDEFWIVKIGSAGNKLRSICSRAGVVMLDTGGSPVPFGTAWMIGSDTIITNAHVARELAHQDGGLPADDPRDRWRMQPGHKGVVNFAFEHQRPASDLVWEIEDVLHVQTSGDPDLAVFRLRNRTKAFPSPVPVDLRSRADWRSLDVFAVGHPIRDQQNDSSNVALVFGELDATKRFSPGKLTAVLGNKVLAHDCSTTNGSSGSPIVDFVSLKAVGLHYFGVPGARNESVLLAAVADHPAIAKSVNNAWS